MKGAEEMAVGRGAVKGAEEMAVGRGAVKGAARWLWAEKLTKDQKKTAAERALPPFVMRGYVLLRLPDQNTITARETRYSLLRVVPDLSLFSKSTYIAWAL